MDEKEKLDKIRDRTEKREKWFRKTCSIINNSIGHHCWKTIDETKKFTTEKKGWLKIALSLYEFDWEINTIESFTLERVPVKLFEDIMVVINKHIDDISCSHCYGLGIDRMATGKDKSCSFCKGSGFSDKEN